LSIYATGQQSDILIGDLRVKDPANGDIELVAGDDILRDGPNSPNVVADELTLRAGNANADGPNAIELNTQVNVLDAVVQGSNEGDLIIDEVDDIVLANLESPSDVIVNANGTVTVEAVQGENISIIATGQQSDILVGDLSVNNSADGDIELVAGDDILRQGASSPNVLADELTLRAG
ncbi:unnamed protein product, partial [Hapterophycus canaliculatus]